MVLILSNEFDFTTTQVLEWLDNLKKKWVRINDSDVISVSFVADDIIFSLPEFEFRLSEITSFWYRRGSFRFENNFSPLISPFKELQNIELNKISEFIYYLLHKKKCINNFFNSDVNKLVVSDAARNLDILTASDYIVSNSLSLKNLDRDQKFITKSISGETLFDFENFTMFSYTSILDLNTVDVPSFFFPSLVQNYIEKKYELRIFYFNDDFYSMAIFSQNDAKTNVDFRNYNKEKPNRNVPYALPKEVENKLRRLMINLNLNCGSIDMIVTPQSDYVFLEVNPIGQFGMISYPCNYNLEKLIANYL